MSTDKDPHRPACRQRAGHRVRRGQSLVEYALVIVLIFLVAQGAGLPILESFVAVATALRSSFTVTDDLTPTPGPSPTVRLPPPPPTMTPLPPTPVVIAMCEVPNLDGYQYNVAVAEWQNYGFSAGTLTKPGGASSTFRIGNQSLAAGNRLPCASTTMHVSPQQCQVPGLQGQQLSAARDGAWFAAGFAKGNLLRPADSDENFTIYSQQHSAGTALDCDATLLVEPRRCTVPNLAGKTFTINGNGSANRAWDDDFPPAGLTRAAGMPDSFTVANQSLAAGSVVYCSASMEVSPALCTVPDLSGALFSGAQTLWANRGFGTSLAKAANTPPDFAITGQSIPAGEQRACGTATMTVQPNMCAVPNMVGASYSAAAGAWKQAPNGFTSDLGRPPTVSGDFQIAQQLTAAGTVIACSQTVVVQPNMCTVPSLNNKTFTQSTAAWAGAGFTGGLRNPTGTGGDFTVRWQQYDAGQAQPCAAAMDVKPQMCTVPNLGGQLYDDVKDTGEAFRNAGFTSTLATAWGGATPTNRRIGGSTPAAGSEVACASTVTVTEQMCTVPNMDGQLYDDVKDTGEVFRNAGFTSTLAAAWGSATPTNRRIGASSPPAGSQAACSSTTVTVSEKLCTVPNLAGQTINSATGTSGVWRVAGFTAGLNGTHSTGTTTPLGWQEYSAGTQLACSATIDVARVCIVPDLINDTWGVASGNSGDWKAAGFTTSNLLKQGTLNTSNQILWQEFAPGTKLFCDGRMKVSRTANDTQPNPPSATPLP